MVGSTFLLAAVVAVVGAGETPQVAWTGSWEAAFRQAIETRKPVMVCINSKDGERANETTARKIYHDPAFVEWSRRFVMVLVSTGEHAAEGACPRFGQVSCRQHLECWKELKARHGEQFVLSDTPGDMVSPQHAWFTPEGTLLRRHEYFLDKSGLVKRMKATLAEMKRARKANAAPGPGGALDAAVRSCAAVALEKLARAESIAALLKRCKLERDAKARKNVFRALGACGGPAADKAAAKALFKAMASDKQKMVRKHAALALRSYAGDSAELVRRRLEQAVLQAKDKDVSRAIVYVLAHVGAPKTTVPVLKKVMGEAREDWAQAFVRGAIGRITGASDEDAETEFNDAGRWLFWEDRVDPARSD
jgi:hypothetical protein